MFRSKSKASPDLESLIRTVIRAAKADPNKLSGYFDPNHPFKPGSYELEDAAGNHAFDDYPELFGITEHEGHCIRAYFQESIGCRYDVEFKNYIQGLIDSVTV